MNQLKQEQHYDLLNNKADRIRLLNRQILDSMIIIEDITGNMFQDDYPELSVRYNVASENKDKSRLLWVKVTLDGVIDRLRG